MKPVATINGVQVFSDKRMTGINNTRITFADGSYADVSTKEVVNKGQGFITLGSPPGGDVDTKPVTTTKTFVASKLSVADVDASVEVMPHSEKQIVVTITGPKSAAEAITMEQDGDEVSIKGAGGGDGGGNVVISGGSVVIGGSVSFGSIRTNHISISTSDEPQTKVSVRVPEGASVNVSGVSGATNIGDTRGQLVLNQQGQSKARVGKVRAAQLFASGQSEIRVAEVQENLTANVSGQSEINVRGGKVGNLVATTSGQSEFTYEGAAVDATLTASGQSEIEVEHVINKPVRSRSGQAEITVRNRD